MRIENAKPGVGVVDKVTGATHKIREVINGIIYFEDNGFPINERAYRLANKPKRGELQSTIKELEGIVTECRLANQQFLKRIAELEKRVEDLKAQRDRYAQKAHDILSGTYFLTRPHRQKWQHVAQVTGCHVTGDEDGRVKIHRGDDTPTINDTCWYSANFFHLYDGEWTDEPFESRIVNPHPQKDN